MTDFDDKKGKELEAYLYASDKARLIAMVQEMADCAGESLKTSVQALTGLNHDLAQMVIDADDRIDEMEEQIDQECLYSIAMRQPMREDLRFIYAVMKIITDLERIGDQAVNVAMRMRTLAEAGSGVPCPMLPQIIEMEIENRAMLAEVMHAFVKEDGEVVYKIRPHRKKVRQIGKTATAHLIQQQTTDVATETPIGVKLAAMLILHHMNRISDHCLNLAERVSFIATGVSPLTLKRQAQDAATSESPK